MNIRVLLADDQALLRGTFKILIDSAPDLEVVGEAGTGRSAVDLAAHSLPDVVLMDIRMPDMDGITATGLIAADERLSRVRVLILTTFEDEDYVGGALRAGASGFLGKGVNPAELLDAIRVVAAGNALLSPAAVKAVIGRMAFVPAGDTQLSQLTPRELEIMTLVAAGLSNDQIAERLVISPVTAKTHVNRAMVKLSARDRAQLVVIAYQTGLARP
jgi:DNA-binding NarL/FixJ family response regulator